MSNDALINALAQQEGKLKRQQDNHEATKAVIAVIGESPRELNKLAKQKKDMAETRANIKKLTEAINK